MILETATIRPARTSDARGIARVEVETWRDAYPTLVPRAYLVGRLDERLGSQPLPPPAPGPARLPGRPPRWAAGRRTLAPADRRGRRGDHRRRGGGRRRADRR